MKYYEIDVNNHMESFELDVCALSEAAGAENAGVVVRTFTDRVLREFTLNGEQKVLFTSTAGRNKKHKAVYTNAAFAKLHPELFRKYYRWVAKGNTESSVINDLVKEYDESKSKADSLYLVINGAAYNNMSAVNKTKISIEYDEAIKSEKSAKEALEAIAVKELLDGNFTAARAKQANAMRLRPGKLIDLRFNEDNTAVVADIEEVFDTPDGKALNVSTFKETVCKQYNCKTTDGLVLARYENVKHVPELKAIDVNGVVMMPSPRQIFSGALTGCDKGLLVVHDNEYKKLIATDAFTGEKIDVTHKNIIFASVVKDYKSYKSQAEYFCGRTYRVMEPHYEMDVVNGSRQMIEMLYGATKEQLQKLADDITKQITAAATKEGYAEECRKLVKELRMDIYAPMANSRIFLNSIAKKFWNIYTHAMGGRFKTKGMTLFVSTSIAGIFNHMSDNNDWHIGEDEVLLPMTAMKDYKIGDEFLMVRYPEMQAKPCILTVKGFHNIEGLAVIHPKKMIEKDADWDGDHANFYSNPTIIEMAKSTLKLFRECEGATYVFEDMAADAAVKTLDLEDNILMTADLGNVGGASTNMFVLAALVPIGATPDTIVHITGIVLDKGVEVEISYALSVKEIIHDMCVMKVAVTLEADSAKRGAASKFAESDIGQMLAAIRSKYIVYSEYFDHPYEVKLDFKNATYCKKGGTPKKILGRKICESILVVLHDMIQKNLNKPVEQFLLNYTDVLNGYEYYQSNDLGQVVKRRSAGWTYVPNCKEYDGIDQKGWMDYALYEKLSVITKGLLKEPMAYGFRKDAYDSSKLYYGGPVVGYKTIDELVDAFLGDLTLRTDDMSPEEARKHFTFATKSKGGSIGFGLIAHRAHVAAKAASVDDENGGRYQSHKKYDRYYENTAILVCAMFSKNFGVELDWELAKKFVANEIRAYLFSKNATEGSASDVADMFDYYRDELAEIRKANGVD